MPARRTTKRTAAPKVRYTGTLVASEEWTCLFFPPEVGEKLGATARTPVAGSINGFAIRSSIFPVGGGRFMLLVNRQMQAGAGVKVGDEVTVELAVDTAPRTVETPADLSKALARSKKVAALFERMAYSHKKEWVDWITDAKKPETRAARIAKTVARLKDHLAKDQ